LFFFERLCDDSLCSSMFTHIGNLVTPSTQPIIYAIELIAQKDIPMDITERTLYLPLVFT